MKKKMRYQSITKSIWINSNRIESNPIVFVLTILEMLLCYQNRCRLVGMALNHSIHLECDDLYYSMTWWFSFGFNALELIFCTCDTRIEVNILFFQNWIVVSSSKKKKEKRIAGTRYGNRQIKFKSMRKMIYIQIVDSAHTLFVEL